MSAAPHEYAARLLGRCLEDPGLLQRMRAAEVRPVDLANSELQAAYALLCHLADERRLAFPVTADEAARTRVAGINLQTVEEWTLARLQARADERRTFPVDTDWSVPSDGDLLLDAAARMNPTRWPEIWESAWPPAPPGQVDASALRRHRLLDALAAVGSRLEQRAGAGVAEPDEVVDDTIAALDQIDTEAVGRYLARGSRQGRVTATTRPYESSGVTRTSAPVWGASTT